MNIIELARKAGLRSAVLLDMYKTKDALTPSEELELEQYQTFANDVIAERDKELIGGVGEPVAKFNWYTGKFEWLTEYSYQLHHDKPLYTAAQVAGAVAKALAKADYAHIPADAKAVLVEQEKRIAELESERDMWKATAEAVVDFEKSQMRLRIESLEAARMAYAREFPLSADGEPDVGSIHANIRAMKDTLKLALGDLKEIHNNGANWSGQTMCKEAISKINEVLHD